MKRNGTIWGIMGFAVTSFVGTILHFLYEWLGEAVLVAPFSGVNESTWEHMKLLFWPMFLFAIVQSFFFRDRRDFWCVKLRGTVLGLMLIPVIFYTYNGVIGQSPDWFNIAIFFISALMVFVYEARQFKKEATICKHPRLALIALCIIGIMFVTFTFFTPQLNIFKDPLTGTYGI